MKKVTKHKTYIEDVNVSMVKADFDYWSNGGQCQFSYSKFEKQF
jgi:hypothetical protein